MVQIFRSNVVLLLLLRLVISNSDAAICNLGRYATPNGCRKCPAGTYKSQKSNATSCSPCPEGTYSTIRGLVYEHRCLPCPRESKSLKGSTSCKPCKKGFVRAGKKCARCPPGTSVRHYGTEPCGKCNEGYIALGWNTEYCEGCPYGLVSNFQRTKCIPVDCDPGYEYDGYECVPCDYNKYRNATMERCEECPFGTVTNNFSGPNIECIRCPAGSYTTDLLSQTFTYESVPLCLTCPPNSTTKGVGKTLCRKQGSKCAPNSIEDSDGDCKTCDYNHRMNFKTRTCVPCAERHVSQPGAYKKCVKCQKGAVVGSYGRCVCKDGLGLRNGVCVPCEKGTASGHYNSCSVCDAGYFAPRKGMTNCISCPEGTRTVGSDRTKCVPTPKCQPGFVFREDFYGDECKSIRTDCAAGLERIVRKGVHVCVNNERKIVCPPKSVFDNVSKCIACGNGFYIANLPESTRLRCKKCPFRSISEGGNSTSCTPCPAGFSASDYYDDLSYCYCKEGKYIRKSDGACMRCPTGSVSRTRNNTRCEKCSNGFTPDYYKRECVCALPNVINHFGKCVKVNDPLEYDR